MSYSDPLRTVRVPSRGAGASPRQIRKRTRPVNVLAAPSSVRLERVPDMNHVLSPSPVAPDHSATTAGAAMQHRLVPIHQPNPVSIPAEPDIR